MIGPAPIKFTVSEALGVGNIAASEAKESEMCRAVLRIAFS